MAGPITSHGPELVRLENRTVEVMRAGQGDPLIVLESGLGDGWTSWLPVLTQLAERSRVLAYSRPGYGASTAASTPRDISTEAHELCLLLRALREDPPYVLVGHSLGGLIVQACAARDSQDIAGLVLVDAPHPDQIEYLNRDVSAAGKRYREAMALASGAPRQEHEALTAPRGGHFASESRLYDGPTIMLSGWLRPETMPQAYQHYRRVKAIEAAAAYPRAELRKIFCGHYVHHERPLALLEAVDEVLARVRNPGVDVLCEPQP